MKIEHRLSQRIPFREPIKYGLDYPTFSGYTFDLSEGGIGIITSKVFPPDTELVFDMYMGEGVSRVEGVVARVTPILSGAASIMGVKISGRTDDIKHIYMQRLNKQHHLDRTTE
jgi:PilZ domain-containing protein